MLDSPRMQAFVLKKLITPPYLRDNFQFVLRRICGKNGLTRRIIREFQRRYSNMSAFDPFYDQITSWFPDATYDKVRYAIDQLRKHGILISLGRYDDSNVYRMTPFFFTDYMKKVMTGFFGRFLLVTTFCANPSSFNPLCKSQLLKNVKYNNKNININITEQEPKKGSAMKYEQADKPDYVNSYSQRDKEPEQIDRRKLFPVYEPPLPSKRDYKADTITVTNWLKSDDEKARLGKEFLATLPEDVVVKLVKNHFAPSEIQDEE